MQPWRLAFLIGFLGLCLCAKRITAQSPTWEQLNEAGSLATHSGHYTEAEKPYREALKLAEEFGSEDARLAVSLNNLAIACQGEGKNSEAEELLQRALVANTQV